MRWPRLYGLKVAGRAEHLLSGALAETQIHEGSSWATRSLRKDGCNCNFALLDCIEQTYGKLYTF